MTRPSSTLHSTNQNTTRAVLIAIHLPDQTEEQVASSLSELVHLAKRIGVTTLQTFVQKRPNTAAPTLLGEGRLMELAKLTGGPGVVTVGPPLKSKPSPVADVPPELPPLESTTLEEGEAPQKANMAIADLELSPGQKRYLTKALGVEVIDRTEVILRLFELRVRTPEARLQVELARLRYQIPRVRDDSSMGDREGGGGRAARGHSNVELARHRIKDRIAAIRRELEGVQVSVASRRENRRDALKVVIVGYTNAGKSSLMRGLTGAQVLVEDLLFATLDTTVRTLHPNTTPRILVSDTVGFIKNLPHDLVASFRSTLEEAREAGMLLVVVDASDSDWREQLKVTYETLAAISAEEVPVQLLFNKLDRVDDATRLALALEFPTAVLMSSRDPADVQRLHLTLVGFFDTKLVEVVLQIPQGDGRLLSDVHSRSRVLEERFTEEDVILRVRSLPAVVESWKSVWAALEEA